MIKESKEYQQKFFPFFPNSFNYLVKKDRRLAVVVNYKTIVS